jgi:hypothetical protein
MPARKRWRGTTTERGYGAAHIHALRRARAAWRPGDPCAHCGQPMWVMWVTDPRNPRRRICVLDLGHNADRSAYVGLAHRACNRSEGASRGNRMRGAAERWASARAW